VIPFTKAHACGNDFLIIVEQDAAGYDKVELAERLCARNSGIGADGIEFFSATGPNAGRITLYNADGSVAEISGNGTRCVAAWMAEELNLQAGDEVTLETDAGVRLCEIDEYRDSDDNGPTVMVTTDMDVPTFEQKAVELADGTVINGVYVNMGNPHFVILLDALKKDGEEWKGLLYPDLQDLAQFNPGPTDFWIGERSWEEIGEEICFHADFPNQTNVEFVRILGPVSTNFNWVAMRIYERGVGPTSSSGTGTSATATAMIGEYAGVSPIEVAAPGGVQTVEWAGTEEKLYLTGPATLIARGEAW
jgi:diaminopimelate epimerase